MKVENIAVNVRFCNDDIDMDILLAIYLHDFMVSSISLPSLHCITIIYLAVHCAYLAVPCITIIYLAVHCAYLAVPCIIIIYLAVHCAYLAVPCIIIIYLAVPCAYLAIFSTTDIMCKFH